MKTLETVMDASLGLLLQRSEQGQPIDSKDPAFMSLWLIYGSTYSEDCVVVPVSLCHQVV